MKNYILEGKTRDEIVRFLQAQVVPANVGAGLIQVATILSQLKEEVVIRGDGEETPKKDDTNKEPEVSA